MEERREKQKAYYREWYQKNKDRLREKRREYQKEYMPKWREKNRENYNEYQRKYRDKRKGEQWNSGIRKQLGGEE